jgi:hypothetical protein
MTKTLIAFAFLACLALLALLWLDGPALLEAAAGQVDRPQIVLAATMAALGAITALLLLLFGLLESGAMREKVTDEVRALDRTIENLFSHHDDRRSTAGIDLNDEPRRRLALYRDGFRRALKLFAVAAVLALIAAVLAATVLFNQGAHLL